VTRGGRCQTIKQCGQAGQSVTTGRLARATGQDDTLDPHAVALLLPWTEANAGLLAASGMFGSRIDVGPGAPDDIRLPGLLGRTT
jgi:hypothetical protein